MRETTRTKLDYLAETKSLIKSALIEKGQEVADEDTFRSYADKILAISGGGSADERVKYVTFMNGATELIKYPVIAGDTCKDVVAENIIEAPTKEQTESTVYSFGGWSLTDGGEADSSALENVTEDRTVYVAFTESARMYTVRFYDGETLVNSEQVAYGGLSTYTYAKDDYIFGGWTPAPTNITGDMDCYAQWIEGVDFATADWSKIAQISELGVADQMFKVGDTRTETLTYSDGTTEDIELQIAGFGFEKDFDTQKPVMTLITKNLISKTSTWATSDTKLQDNYHTSATIPFKTLLTDTVFPALSDDLRAVAKRCINNSLGSSFNSAGYAFYIMPPHEYNMGYYYSTTAKVTEGKTYPIFTADNSSRVKTRNGVADMYPVYMNSNSVTNYSVTNKKNAIRADGSLNAGDTKNTTFGVCFLLFI